MDKKNKKKTVIKRKTGEETSAEDKKPKIDEMKCDNKIEVEVIDGQNEHQIVQASQLVEGNFEQQVFVNLKGEPVQLGPNTVIVYEQNTGTPSNFAFGGMWTMDQSGRIVMGDTVYDVKGEPEDDSGGTFVQNNTEITNVNESSGQFQQYEISNSNSTNTVDGNQHYQVSILEKDQQDNSNQHEETVVEQTESELDSQSTVRWLNQKYDILVRKLQMNYDAGVKLLHTQGGCIQCVYLTTPGMQMAFNAVPQFLCIDSSVEFTSILPGTNGSTGISHHVVLFLAEDGNGKSVIVSAGISPIQVHMNWLLETFKSCNPAWKSVRCIVAEPEKHIQAVMYAWPSNRRDYTARLKQYALSLLRDNPTDHQKNQMRKQLSQVGSSVLNNLETVLETENYTNVLHKNLERLLTRFQNVTLTATQPEDFIASFFQIADQLEQERRNYAILRLRETESLKQSPTDTITQYAYNLMSHQTKLAQKCLDDKAGKRHSTAAICKYGTSTQECSCLFSKVFKLPCRHILMLTTELKVRTHIPFEPRWTVQHCLFGCETMQTTPGNNSEFIEQIVVENEQQQQQQQGVTGRQQQQQQQYVLATSSPAQSVPQVIFCSPAAGGTTSSVVPGTAVLAQHAIIPDNH